MKLTLPLVGTAVVLGMVGALVSSCDPERPHETSSAPSPSTPAQHHDRSAAAKLVARRQAGDVFSRRMREHDLDIKVTTHGKRHTILRLSGPNCGTEALAAFARESAQYLRDIGFEHLECRGRFERADMDL